MDPRHVVGWLVDPAHREEMLGDLTERMGRARRRRVWIDVASICMRPSLVGRAVPRVLVASLVLSLILLAGSRPQYRVVRAMDAGGAFTLAFDGGRVVAATLDGVPVAAERLVQSAGRLDIRGGDGPRDLVIDLHVDGSFTWCPRRAARAPMR